MKNPMNDHDQRVIFIGRFLDLVLKKGYEDFDEAIHQAHEDVQRLMREREEQEKLRAALDLQASRAAGIKTN